MVHVEEVLLSRTLARIFNNVKTLFRDRGYDLERTPSESQLVAALIMKCIKNGEPVLKGHTKDRKSYALTFFSDSNKLPIHSFRDMVEWTNQYMEDKAADVKCVVLIITKDGMTPATKQEMLSYEDTITFESWTHKELLHNITKHELFPPHIPLSPRSTQQVLTRYQTTQDKLYHMSRNDPVAKYYAFQPGTVVKIERRLGLTQPCTVYRLVK